MTEWLVEKHPSEQHTADRPTGVPTKEPLHASTITKETFPALLAPATCQNVRAQIQACHEIAIPVILGSCVATRQGGARCGGVWDIWIAARVATFTKGDMGPRGPPTIFAGLVYASVNFTKLNI